jgi:hypothetical protein
MAGRLYNLNVADQARTYDSGGQLPFPGVMIGNERANIGLAPDNDAKDAGVDVFANVDNGTGPQFDGPGHGIMLDLDTNSGREGYSVAGVDDSDGNIGSDVAVNDSGGRMTDESFLAVHLSGTEDHTVDGPGQEVESQPVAGPVFDGGTTGVQLVDFDDA